MNRKKHQLKTLLLSLSLAFSCLIHAQNEGNIWYFGENAGIDFNTGTPVSLSNGALFTFEGCATICDNNGSLLFYTDGITVWNSNHQPMPNGNGNLLGNPSSTQSAIIVKQPGNNTIYYIFTVDDTGGPDGLRYTEVDMSLQSGLGDVNTNVNIQITDPTTEKVAAIKNQNGNSFWIVTKLYGTNTYHSYPLTSTGLSLTPVVSTAGQMPIDPFSNSVGYLKASPDGTKLASVCWGENYFELLDFDQATGIISNPIYFSLSSAYGAEFSPNSNLLYVSSLWGVDVGVHQYDLLAGTPNDIINSDIVVGTSPSSCALQLAPDGKIYEAQSNSSYLGTISNPNGLGTSCNYNPTGFQLAASTLSTLGLPTFSNIANINLFSHSICVGDSITLVDSYNNNHNWITSIDPTTIFSQDSIITVAPTISTDYMAFDGNDTTTFSITVFNPIPIDLGNDTSLCANNSLILAPTGGGLAFQWQDGSTNDSLTVNTAGQYWVDVTGQGNCISSDTIMVNFDAISAQITNTIDESCIGSANGGATLQNINSISTDPLTVTWQDPSGNTFSTQTTTNGGSLNQTNLYAGLWQVIVTSSSGCSWDTTFLISAGSTVSIGTSVSHPQCYGTSNGAITAYALNPGSFNFSIEDANGNLMNNSGTNTANSLPSGIYTVSVFDNNGCENQTTITLIDPPAIDVDLSLIHPKCHGDLTGSATVDTVWNAQGNYNLIYYGWDPNPNGTNGLNEIQNQGLGAGEYVLEIVDDIGCSNEVTFFITEPNPLIGVVEVISPTYCRTEGYQKGNGEVIVTTGGPNQSGSGNVFYHWKNLENGDESSNTTFIVNVPGVMEITLTDGNGCTYVEQITVDSLNPIADFTLESDQFEGPGEFEGTEALEIELINLSSNFAKPSYLLSDTTFRITWYNNEPGNENGNWFFSYDYDEKIDTTLMGEIEYEVCLVAKNYNNCKDSICKIVTVHAFPELVAPNVFTPGSDPNNTFFFPNKAIETFNCSVFNRYGVEVFHFSNINQAWDGNNIKNGKPCKAGTYFYTYQATSTNGTAFNGQGTVQIVRDQP